ncbi:hypothetical protein ACQJBY_032223 [Aegilops geniculata]
MEEPPRYKFGPYKIDAREVFHATPLSYAMVNLRPLLPGSLESLFSPSPCLASMVLFAVTIQCQSAAPDLESRYVYISMNRMSMLRKITPPLRMRLMAH